MFFRNDTASHQREKTRFCGYLIIALTSLVLIAFCANLAGTASVKAAYKYQEIKALSKNLKKDNAPENVEKLIEKSRGFIAAHPKYKRVDEVYYILGNTFVQLERVEEGIAVFEALTKDYPSARSVKRCLLQLGLAYDKLSMHEKADEAYKKLVNHPKYGSGSQAKTAKQILALERAERNGQPPSPFGLSSTTFIGKPAKDFQVTDLKGEELSLEKYRGQVVLLDFWATWCGPCKDEMPHVKKAYEKYKDQQFEIIGISLDRAKPPLEAYIQKEGIEWPQFLDHGGTIAKMYNVRGIPATFLIDSEGIIRKVNLRGNALENAVAELVTENLAKQAK